MKKLSFRYENWRGGEHLYVVIPESIQFREIETSYYSRSLELHWVLHAFVFSRDGKLRRGRRSFILSNLKEITEVEA